MLRKWRAYLRGNLHAGQFAFFGFCAGNRHQILERARVKAVNVTPKVFSFFFSFHFNLFMQGKVCSYRS